MFWSIPPSCGQRSPLQKLKGPIFVWIALRVPHLRTSAVAAASSLVVEQGRPGIDRTRGAVVADEVCGRLRRLPRGDGPVRRARIENRSLGCVVDDVDPLVVGVVLVCSRLCVRRTAEERVAGLTRV